MTDGTGDKEGWWWCTTIATVLLCTGSCLFIYFIIILGK